MYTLAIFIFIALNVVCGKHLHMYSIYICMHVCTCMYYYYIDAVKSFGFSFSLRLFKLISISLIRLCHSPEWLCSQQQCVGPSLCTYTYVCTRTYICMFVLNADGYRNLFKYNIIWWIWGAQWWILNRNYCLLLLNRHMDIKRVNKSVLAWCHLFLCFRHRILHRMLSKLGNFHLSGRRVSYTLPMSFPKPFCSKTVIWNYHASALNNRIGIMSHL